ncbi:MAG TPA: hypothetical protein VNH18_02005, partial [Bryobacteraceae bacterium]|nr:hypothetical protein [Bryobacteraceae bacterium]
FVLTAGELEAARQLAAEKRSLVVVGFYCTKTRGAITPSPAELQIFGELCPEPWQIMVVLRPSSVRPSTATIFYREASGRVTQGLERDVPEWAPPEPEAGVPERVAPVVRKPAALQPADLKPGDLKPGEDPAQIPTPVAKLMFSEPPPPPRARTPVAPVAADHGPHVHFSEAQPGPAASARSNEPPPEAVHTISVRFKKPPPPPVAHSAAPPSGIDSAAPPAQGPRVQFSEEQPKQVSTPRPEVPLSAPARGPSIQFSAPPPPPSQPRDPDAAASNSPVDRLKSWFVDAPPPPSTRTSAPDPDTDPSDKGSIPDQPHGFKPIRAIMLMPETAAVHAAPAPDGAVGEPNPEPPPTPRPHPLFISDEEAAAAASSVPTDATGFESVNRIQLLPRKPRLPVLPPNPEDYFYTPPVRQPISPRRKLIMWGVAGILAAALAAATSSQWLPQPLKLELSDANGHVTALWNADAVDRGVTGTLNVIDGAQSVSIPLNAAQVATGVVGFDRKSDNLSATLKIGDATATATFKSVGFAPQAPTPPAKLAPAR